MYCLRDEHCSSMSGESLTLEENFMLSLLGIAVALVFFLWTLYRAVTPVKRKNASKDSHNQRSSQTHEQQITTDEINPWPWDVTGFFAYPRRFVFAPSTSEVCFVLRRLIPCLFYRIWQKYRHGRVVLSSPRKLDRKMTSESFPLTRLVASTDLVVAYSKEFVNEFSSSPRPKGKRKRYALILKSATPEAKAKIERYFGAVVEDILSVRQVSPFVYIRKSAVVTVLNFRFPASLLSCSV